MKPVQRKTEQILRNLSKSESNEIGLRVERHIKTDMAYIVNQYVNNYRHAVADTFGWTRDDLMQEVRLALSKGLATFDVSKNFKITTYLSVILFNRFVSLAKQIRATKHSSTKLVCVETIFESEGDLADGVDDWMDCTTSLSYFLDKLTAQEGEILHLQLIHGYSVAAIAELFAVPKHHIAAVVKSMKRKLRAHVKELEDEEDAASYDAVS